MIDERIKKEAEDFDLIALERFNNKQRPDIMGKWENNYYYNRACVSFNYKKKDLELNYSGLKTFTSKFLNERIGTSGPKGS